MSGVGHGMDTESEVAANGNGTLAVTKLDDSMAET